MLNVNDLTKVRDCISLEYVLYFRAVSHYRSPNPQRLNSLSTSCGKWGRVQEFYDNVIILGRGSTFKLR